MQKSTIIFSLASVLLIFFVTSTSMSEILFIDNFEDDAIGKPATKWAIGHDGKDNSKVIKEMSLRIQKSMILLLRGAQQCKTIEIP